MAKNVRLNILLPRNRNHPGWLRVEVDGIARAEFKVLGRGSTTVNQKPTGNPTRNPFYFAGDTPTGDYSSQGIVSTGDWEQKSYGPWGAVRLKAAGGDALVAERLGRTGLLIHGGSPGTPSMFDGYRSTLGCLRLSNSDMKQLVVLISSAGADPKALKTTAVTVEVNVRE
jgi:lipoprotein-anchoring transpeptidase ErfK/SrfK